MNGKKKLVMEVIKKSWMKRQNRAANTKSVSNRIYIIVLHLLLNYKFLAIKKLWLNREENGDVKETIFGTNCF